MRELLKPFLSLFANKETKPEITFLDSWVTLLEEDFPLYERLPEEYKEILHEKIVEFISSKTFVGCNGFELSDEVIVLISAHACTLILKQEGTVYPKLNTILIYPSTFQSVQKNVDANGIVTEEVVSRLGESWTSGSVVLAWDSVLNGARNRFDAHNVAIHEFAHQLDQEDGVGDGVPYNGLTKNKLHVWCHVMEECYNRFIKIAEKPGKTVINRYGATNHAEFFAVLSETFFEKPKQLNKKWPDLYDIFKDYYDLDPLSWKGNNT